MTKEKKINLIKIKTALYIQKLEGDYYLAYNLVDNGSNCFLVRSSNYPYFGKELFESYTILPEGQSNTVWFYDKEENIIKQIEQDIEQLIQKLGFTLA